MKSVFIACVLAAGAVANAQIISYTNLGPGDSYDQGQGYDAGTSRSNLGVNLWSASQFRASESGQISFVRVAAGLATGTNAITVNIYADAGDNQVGRFLGGATARDVLPFFGQGSGVVSVRFAGGPVLSEGLNYWVEVAPGDFDTYLFWNLNSTGDRGFVSTLFEGTRSYRSDLTKGAMEVQVVPEPATLLVLGAGALMAFRRRRAR